MELGVIEVVKIGLFQLCLMFLKFKNVGNIRSLEHTNIPVLHNTYD